MIMEFDEFSIHGKLMKQEIMKLESSDSDLISERYPYFKINKNSNQIWAKVKNKTTFKEKFIS